MIETIFAAILFLMPGPSPKWNETHPEFKERMMIISRTIREASKIIENPVERRHLEMAMVVTYWGEGRFSPLVQSGEHRGDGGLAICLGGLHQNKLTEVEWLGLAGLDYESSLRCANVTAQRMVSAKRYCQGLDVKFSWPEAMVLYGTGRTCRANESKWENIFLDRGTKWATIRARF